jgi:hypothetical protein
MPVMQRILTDAVVCDKRDCGERLPIPHPEWQVWSAHFTSYIARAGWSKWVSRGHRYYCPAHGPSSPNMRQVI